MQRVLESDGEQFSMSRAPTYKPLEIEVADFGPIAKAKIDLRPLTVFVGPSNTGKSYLATLIYALHRFFGGYTTDPRLNPRDVPLSLFPFFGRFWLRENEREVTAAESNALLSWAMHMLMQARAQGYPEGFRALVSDEVAPLLRPLLREAVNRGEPLEDEIARCFGSENTARLIRHGSKHGSRVVLKRHVAEAPRKAEPFAYEFNMNGRDHAFSTSLPDAMPLQIVRTDNDPWYHLKLRKLASLVDEPRDDEEDRTQRHADLLLRSLADVIGTAIVSPLHRVAHYLPADRAGVMHAHRVVLAFLIQQSSRAVLQRDQSLPLLSGVLTDFLEQLVSFGDLAQRKKKDEWLLDTALEKQVLGGIVLAKQSAIGLPVFSYQPAGRKEEIPLIQTSSMVSELAPVVLYLRHVVQPGDVLIIEEPESHLHPGMQAAFTRQLAAMVRAGVRVIITTHSGYVLEELANLVRMSELPASQRADLEGEVECALSPHEVGVWLFEPRKRPKGSVVKEITLDKDVGIFPAGYGDVTEALYNTSVEIDSRIREHTEFYEPR